MTLSVGDRRTGLEFWGFSWTCGLELFPTLVPYSACRRGLDELVSKVFLALTCRYHILNLDRTMEKVSSLLKLRWWGAGLRVRVADRGRGASVSRCAAEGHLNMFHYQVSSTHMTSVFPEPRVLLRRTSHFVRSQAEFVSSEVCFFVFYHNPTVEMELIGWITNWQSQYLLSSCFYGQMLCEGHCVYQTT